MFIAQDLQSDALDAGRPPSPRFHTSPGLRRAGKYSPHPVCAAALRRGWSLVANMNHYNIRVNVTVWLAIMFGEQQIPHRRPRQNRGRVRDDSYGRPPRAGDGVRDDSYGWSPRSGDGVRDGIGGGGRGGRGERLCLTEHRGAVIESGTVTPPSLGAASDAKGQEACLDAEKAPD